VDEKNLMCPFLVTYFCAEAADRAKVNNTSRNVNRFIVIDLGLVKAQELVPGKTD
jgi:hypothetical protein